MSHVFVQVAPQVASVMIYLTEASHVVWDLHSEDTILDIFGYPRQPGSFDLAGRFHAPGWVPLLQSASNQML